MNYDDEFLKRLREYSAGASSQIEYDNKEKRKLNMEPNEDRDEIYTQMAAHYIKDFHKRHKQKHKYKQRFFWIAIGGYCAVVLTCLIILLVATFCPSVHLSVVISSAVSLVITVIALPQIIANYLFPKKEDESDIKMLEQLFEYDLRIKDKFLLEKKLETSKEDEDNKLTWE